MFSFCSLSTTVPSLFTVCIRYVLVLFFMRRPFLVCSNGFVPIGVGGGWTPRAYGERAAHLLCYIKKIRIAFSYLKPSVSSVQSEDNNACYPYTRLVPLQAVAYLESRNRGIPLTKKKASYRRPPHHRPSRGSLA